MGKKKSNASPHRLRIRAERSRAYYRKFGDLDRKELFTYLPLIISPMLAVTVVIALVVSWSDVRGSYFLRPEDYGKTGGIVKSVNVREGGGRSRNYIFDIQYAYKVNGQSFTGSRISYSLASGQENDMYDYLKQYPAGHAITVYYDKSDPSYAALNHSRINRTS